jgi:glycosyltransferase involved in cell wall biosynthesis
MHRLPPKKTPTILLIGPTPPPMGGVSIHLQRLADKLELEGYSCRIANDAVVPGLYLPFWLLFHLLHLRLSSNPIVHVHSGNWRLRFFTTALSRVLRIPVVVTVHSFRPVSNNKTLWIIKKVMKYANHLIVTNPEIQDSCIAYDAQKSLISVQYAYLDPPLKSDVSLAPKVQSFIDDHEIIIAANGSQLRFHKNEDLYGLDLLIELCARLHSDYPKIAFLFMLPQIGLEDYYEKCLKQINTLKIQDNFKIFLGASIFVDILRKSDLMIRPTNTDGDSLSIREAAFLGVPIIASDAIVRSKECILFENRNLDSLEEKVRACLKNHEKPTPLIGQDGWATIQKIYGNLTRG